MRCSICYGELPDPKGVCPGQLPGPCGLVQFSPGPCASTVRERAEVDARRAEMARKEAERQRDSRGAKANTEVEDA